MTQYPQRSLTIDDEPTGRKSATQGSRDSEVTCSIFLVLIDYEVLANRLLSTIADSAVAAKKTL